MAPQPASTLGWFQPSPVPDVATTETIRFMCGVIDGSAKNPAIKRMARDAVERFGPLGSYDPSGVTYDPRSAGYLARAVYWFARHTITRLHHDEFKAIVAAFPEKKQLLVAPDETSLMLLSSHPQGDCSAFTMAICALLHCLGVGYELVAVAQEDVFSHVYPRAILEDGTRLVLDAHAGDYPGWEGTQIVRKQVYDSQGSPVSDQPSQFKGLHAYTWRGLGDCAEYDEYGNCIDEFTPTAPSTGSGTTTLAPLFGGAPACPSGYIAVGSNCFNPSNPNNALVGGSAAATPASSASPWTSIFSNLANAWTNIGSRVIAPSTTISTGPGGTQIVTPGSSPLSSSLLGTTTGMSGTSLAILAALAVGAILLLKGNR